MITRNTTRLMPMLNHFAHQKSHLATLTLLAPRPALRASLASSRSLRTVAEWKSLANLAPEVASQWHPTKNGDLTAVDMAYQSNKKCWWQCEVSLDHEWEASPYNRVVRGTGCPCCRGLKVSTTNSLASLAPEIAAQWHQTKNGELTPADVVSRSGKDFWWQCDVSLDHEWKARPSVRVGKGSGCPCCEGRKVSVTNSLATVKPLAAALWDPIKNGDLMPTDVVASSHRKHWFVIPGKGAVQRALGSFKREVGESVARAPSVLLSDASPKVAAQWHPTKNGDLLPTDITSGSDKKYWWQCDVSPDHEWQVSSANRVASGSGCPFCRNLKVSMTNSLASLAPEVATQWHPTKNGNVTPENVVSQTSKKYWWRCDADSDHDWEASPSNRVGRGSGCPYCRGDKRRIYRGVVFRF
jgi:hypothetical protein